MNFSDQPPSQRWAALKVGGEVVAEAWFKPDGDPLALAFRIPRASFAIPGVGPRLTAAGLLKAVGAAAADVESWRQDGSPAPDSDLGRPLPPPPPDVPYLNLSIRLRPPAPTEAYDAGIPEWKWQDLEARWNAILAVEAGIETMRVSMEGLRAEMEVSAGRTLNTEEKLHALQADVIAWTKAKTRLHHVLPKTRDFIHRATWAAGAPERKRLDEIIKGHVQPRIPFPEMDRLGEQLDLLLKDRQVLSSLGVSIYQDCKSVSTDVLAALATLKGNAAANATRKRASTVGRGKSTRGKAL